MYDMWHLCGTFTFIVVGGKYECQYCDMTFNNSGSVTNHMKRRHSEVHEALKQISQAKKIERRAIAMKANNAKKRQNIFKLTKGRCDFMSVHLVRLTGRIGKLLCKNLNLIAQMWLIHCRCKGDGHLESKSAHSKKL